MPPRPRHQPQRTCVACRQTGNKRGLVRVVRTPAGEVAIDVTGKLAGRGAYLCKRRTCWEQALKRKALDRALKMTLDAEACARLAAFAQDLPDDVADDDTAMTNQDE